MSSSKHLNNIEVVTVSPLLIWMITFIITTMGQAIILQCLRAIPSWVISANWRTEHWVQHNSQVSERLCARIKGNLPITGLQTWGTIRLCARIKVELPITGLKTWGMTRLCARTKENLSITGSRAWGMTITLASSNCWLIVPQFLNWEWRNEWMGSLQAIIIISKRLRNWDWDWLGKFMRK